MRVQMSAATHKVERACKESSKIYLGFHLRICVIPYVPQYPTVSILNIALHSWVFTSHCLHNLFTICQTPNLIENSPRQSHYYDGNLQIRKGWRIMVFFFFFVLSFLPDISDEGNGPYGWLAVAFVGAGCPIEVFSWLEQKRIFIFIFFN